MSAGKGPDPRPLSVSRRRYERNFDRTFGKPEEAPVCGRCGSLAKYRYDIGRETFYACPTCPPPTERPELYR